MRDQGNSEAALSASGLREAAITYLARFAASQAGLARVLTKRIARWERRALDLGDDPDAVRTAGDEARSTIGGLIASLVASGALDDAVFAESRARSLARAGRSRRAIAAHLAGRGIEADASRTAIETAGAGLLEDPAEQELAAALVQARRRRIGPFRIGATGGDTAGGDTDSGDTDSGGSDAATRQHALAALARAGFSHDTATRALDTDRAAAEHLIARLRG